MNSILVTTDGSCPGNPGFGGWAARLDTSDGEIFRVSGGESTITTNNRMELKAIIEGLRKVRELCPDDACSIVVHTDSKYITNSMTFRWSRAKNRDLWDELDEVLPNNITWEHIPRNSTEEHKECDKIAKLESKKVKSLVN